ncbi:hypothetical protein ACFO3K_14420 [Cellulomonas algicola]
MVTLRIDDVPEDVRDVLATRARSDGLSLEAYLLAVVLREASSARNRVLVSGLSEWTTGTGVTGENVLSVRSTKAAASGWDDD